MSKLTLGNKTGDLGVQVVPGEPWTCSRRLRKITVVNGEITKTPIAWPAVPDLHYPELNMTIVAVLSADEETDTDDSVATWHMTAEQTALLQTGHDARLRLQGESVYIGRVTCRS